jgi:tight adherence protein C
MSTLFVSIAFLFLVAAAAFSVYLAWFSSNRAVEERFADIAVKMRAAQGDAALADENFGRTLFKWASQRIAAPDRDSAKGERIFQVLAHAGFLKNSAGQTYQVVRVLSGIAGALLGLIGGVLISKGSSTLILLFTLGGAGIGLFLPAYWLGQRARTRQNNISRQLSDVLDLLVVCVEAGLGLYEAIKIVGAECERQGQEIGLELNLVATDISAGASLGQALRSLADRTAVEDIKPLAATLIQSEQLGAQVAPALHASSDQLRMRRKLRAEEQAQKASVKILIPLICFVLPSMIAVIVGPAMIEVLKSISSTSP